MLDEVVFIARTTNPDDLAWLDLLLTTEPAYSRMNVTFKDKDYRSAYDNVRNGTMYIKIDDDIVRTQLSDLATGESNQSQVFMEDSVIPTITYTKWMHPEYFIVSANIMNQPSLSWVHYHLGAVKPYLPETVVSGGSTPSDEPQRKPTSWRASELPEWDGPPDFHMTDDWTSPHPQHRWLPLGPSSTGTRTLDDTPIVQTSYDAFSNGLRHWTIAAQEHYSFFDNLERGELFRYKFHRWDYNYTRMGIQFVAIMGDDINLGKPMTHHDDEYYFSEVMPARTRRRG
jgi:hypothetical protein